MERGIDEASSWCSVGRAKIGGGRLALDVEDSSSHLASRVKNGGGKLELEEVDASSYCVARTIRRGMLLGSRSS